MLMSTPLIVQPTLRMGFGRSPNVDTSLCVSTWAQPIRRAIAVASLATCFGTVVLVVVLEVVGVELGATKLLALRAASPADGEDFDPLHAASTTTTIRAHRTAVF
jgi:hypothetical protein